MISPTIFKDSPTLHIAAADYFLKIYQKCIEEKNVFHVALSGGTTPKYLFQLLAKSPYAEKINWSKVHIYFGDERFVPHTHDDSNFKMASQALLEHVELPQANIHQVATDLANAHLAAENYQSIMNEFLSKDANGTPQFDLVLLGLGPDGHTASLFPDTDILQQHKKLCDAVFVKKFNSWRISITFPVINHAKHILLLSEGDGKVDIVKELVNIEQNEKKYPVQMIKPENEMCWYIDKAAAKGLI